MVDYLLEFSASRDPDTTIEWFDIGIDQNNTMPQEYKWTMAGSSWFIELFTIPGRYQDRLYMYLMKLVGNTYNPVADMPMEEGVQITVDNEMRVHAYRSVPTLEDNYITDDSTGEYIVLVSEV